MQREESAPKAEGRENDVFHYFYSGLMMCLSVRVQLERRKPEPMINRKGASKKGAAMVEEDGEGHH